MGNYSPTIEEKENEYSQILENVVVHSSRSTFHRVLSLSGSYVATVDTEVSFFFFLSLFSLFLSLSLSFSLSRAIF